MHTHSEKEINWFSHTLEKKNLGRIVWLEDMNFHVLVSNCGYLASHRQSHGFSVNFVSPSNFSPVHEPSEQKISSKELLFQVSGVYYDITKVKIYHTWVLFLSCKFVSHKGHLFCVGGCRFLSWSQCFLSSVERRELKIDKLICYLHFFLLKQL